MTQKSIITTGTFDGVHRGHRLVIETLKKIAAEQGLRPVLLTFDSHPLATIAPERCPPAIMSTERRDNILTGLGITPVVLHFDSSLRATTVDQWFSRLASEYNAGILLKGYDNTFGSDGRGMPVEEYNRIAACHNISLMQAPILPEISSSAIRKAVKAGDLGKASEMLGSPFEIVAPVERGEQLGRKLGFPTANLHLPPRQLLPPPGAYASIATLPDGRKYKAAVNIGLRPTVESHGLVPSVEAHLLDFSGDLYGSMLGITPVAMIRPEIKFNSIEELCARIKEDIRETDKQLSSCKC